jgi:LAS superfamily LD-carboxypeptidase LdcB
MSKDNYLQAKKYGWIPSYPEGAQQQGPEPEAWEYVWVGTASLH